MNEPPPKSQRGPLQCETGWERRCHLLREALASAVQGNGSAARRLSPPRGITARRPSFCAKDPQCEACGRARGKPWLAAPADCHGVDTCTRQISSHQQD